MVGKLISKRSEPIILDASRFIIFLCLLFLFPFFFPFLFREARTFFFFTTRNLTGIVSVKKASIKGKSTVELTEEEAAVVVQKGRTNIKI